MLKLMLVITALIWLTGCENLMPKDDSKRLGNFEYTVDENCATTATGRTSYGAPPIHITNNSQTGDCSVSIETGNGKALEVLQELIQ